MRFCGSILREEATGKRGLLPQPPPVLLGKLYTRIRGYRKPGIELFRVDARAVFQDLEMEMRPCRKTGFAHKAYDIALTDFYALFRVKAVHMAVLGSDGLYEAAGTAYGVVFRPFPDLWSRKTYNRMTGKIDNLKKWPHYGRLKIFIS